MRAAILGQGVEPCSKGDDLKAIRFLGKGKNVAFSFMKEASLGGAGRGG